MRLAILTSLLALGCSLGNLLHAQSTISDRPWELTSSHGVWAAFLPDYELGTAAAGPAFQDDLNNVGYITDLKMVRRFLGTRTSFETNAFYALAGSSFDGSVSNISVPDPATGGANPFAGDRRRLDSHVDHYGFDITLRDTWRTRFGGLSAGCAFSYMAFDQDFDIDYGTTQLMEEELNTDFRGGKAVFGWDGRLHGRPSNFDLLIGFYDMDTEYRFIGQAIAGADSQEFSRNATTIETYFTTRCDIRGCQVGWKIGAMYISDMPVIEHTPTQRASINSDDAVTLSGIVEILL
ncbi:MAG: hypothetical protein AAGG48_02045 [Planctomycetota bacterium]